MLKKYHKLDVETAKLFNTDNHKEWETLNKELCKVEDNIATLAKKVDLYFNKELEVCDKILNGEFLLLYFKAQRATTPNKVTTTTKQNFSLLYDTSIQLNKQFIQYLVNLKTSQAFSQIRGNNKKVEEINKWFLRFERSLRELFDSDILNLVFYDETFDFKIEYDGKSFGLNELSDGYSSLLAILTELILRMEAHKVKAYDMQGVVLIDEIETHLHVELQKKILPFLVSFFPRIQFIVTTHSPFVLSSLSNAVICDLETRFVTSDLSSYSYDALIESYFNSDKYSKEVKEKILRFEELSLKKLLSDSEKDEYMNFRRYFKNLPTFMADELKVKIQQIILNSL
jgi:predicted ATP-binding protein involved in virulence